jgi:hypothetical protein
VKLQSYSKKEVGQALCEPPPTSAEVKSAVNSLVKHKASGLDGLFNEASGGPAMIDSLVLLFDGLRKMERSPSIWARATIHLILNSVLNGHDADACVPSLYRPISLTSSISKVFEQVFLKH